MHHPPNAPDHYHEELLSYLSVLILGDFNLLDVDWCTQSSSSKRSDAFCDLVYDCGFSQLITDPTHCRGNILDLVLTNNLEMLANVRVCCDHFQIETDHYPIYLDILQHTLVKSSTPVREVYNYSKTDLDGLTDYLLDCDFFTCLSSSDIETVWPNLTRIIVSSVKMFTPKVKLRAHPSPPL